MNELNYRTTQYKRDAQAHENKKYKTIIKNLTNKNKKYMQHLNSNQINCCSLVLTQVLQEQSMTPINRASLTLILEQFKPYFPSIGELFKIENPTERMKVMSEDWHEVNIAPIPATLFENWVLNAFSTYWLTELTKQHTEKVLPEEQKVIEPEVTIESEPADIREPITPTEQ